MLQQVPLVQLSKSIYFQTVLKNALQKATDMFSSSYRSVVLAFPHTRVLDCKTQNCEKQRQTPDASQKAHTSQVS